MKKTVQMVILQKRKILRSSEINMDVYYPLERFTAQVSRNVKKAKNVLKQIMVNLKVIRLRRLVMTKMNMVVKPIRVIAGAKVKKYA